MIRALFMIAALFWAAQAPAQTAIGDDQVVRITSAEVAETPDKLARRLGRMLPEVNAPIPAGEGTFALSFVGSHPPRQFSDFLKENFPDIRDAAFRPGVPTNVSLMITTGSPGSNVQLVLVMPKTHGIQDEAERAHKAIFGQPFPQSAEIYVSQAASTDTPSNIVIGLSQDRGTATETYATWLEEEGFEVDRSDRDGNALVIAHREGLFANLFFLDDPDRVGGSIMVLQHLEE